MRRRLFQSAAAATLAVVVMLPSTAVPAHADHSAVRTETAPTDILTYISIANGAFTLIGNILGGAGPSIAEAIRQISARIDEARTQILSHIDAIATAEARACARHHVIEFADINRFFDDVLQSWAQNVTGCVTRIDSLIDTVSDKRQSDLLGLALDIAGPIALAARIKAGFSTAGLTHTVRHGNTAVIAKLEPNCSSQYLLEDPPGILEEWYTCTAYNGDIAGRYACWYRGEPCSEPMDRAAVQNQATSGTSRALAQAVLPNLQF